MNEDTLLSARGLTLHFGRVPALVNVDADLWPGEVLAVVGESGSGKTTLLNVLSGRMKPDAGVTWYRDPQARLHDVHAMPAPALPRSSVPAAGQRQLASQPGRAAPSTSGRAVAPLAAAQSPVIMRCVRTPGAR